MTERDELWTLAMSDSADFLAYTDGTVDRHALLALLRRVRDAERERCAKVCERTSCAKSQRGYECGHDECRGADRAAEAIRTPAQTERGPAPKAEGDERG